MLPAEGIALVPLGLEDGAGTVRVLCIGGAGAVLGGASLFEFGRVVRAYVDEAIARPADGSAVVVEPFPLEGPPHHRDLGRIDACVLLEAADAEQQVFEAVASELFGQSARTD